MGAWVRIDLRETYGIANDCFGDFTDTGHGEALFDAANQLGKSRGIGRAIGGGQVDLFGGLV